MCVSILVIVLLPCNNIPRWTMVMIVVVAVTVVAAVNYLLIQYTSG